VTHCRTYLKCCECGRVLATIAFYRDPRYKSGRKQPCKACLRRRRGDPGWRERQRIRDAKRREKGEPQRPPQDEEPVESWLRRRRRVAMLEGLG
jgi:hypothetical protein